MFFLKSLLGLPVVCLMAVLAASLVVHPARAQAVESATRPGHSLWVGGEYSNIHAGFPYQSDQRLWGVGAFADYHLTVHLALEAEARFLRFNSFYGETEDNYLAGPRYTARSFGKLQPYSQCLAGIGKIQYPFQIGSGSYLALTPGAGVNYRIGGRWLLRGEYEYQFWLNSPNFSNEPSHQIAPNGFHVGLAYRLMR